MTSLCLVSLLLINLLSCSSEESITNTQDLDRPNDRQVDSIGNDRNSGRDQEDDDRGSGRNEEIDVSWVENKYLDISYSDVSESQKIDIYIPPKGVGPWPVIFSIHGGGSGSGTKRGSDLEYALDGLDRGYAVVATDYRLCGEATYPAAIDGLQEAIAYVHRNAETWNLDTTRFVTWGSSAGVI